MISTERISFVSVCHWWRHYVVILSNIGWIRTRRKVMVAEDSNIHSWRALRKAGQCAWAPGIFSWVGRSARHDCRSSLIPASHRILHPKKTAKIWDKHEKWYLMDRKCRRIHDPRERERDAELPFARQRALALEKHGRQGSVSRSREQVARFCVAL